MFGDEAAATITRVKKPKRTEKKAVPAQDDESDVLYVRMPPAVQTALRDYIRANPLKPKKQAVGLEALVAFLEAKGYWPPKEA